MGARMAYDTPTQARMGRLDTLQEARFVTVIASGDRANGQDALRGQDVWLLIFAYLPANQPATIPAGNGDTLRWESYALISVADSQLLTSCTSPL